MKRCICFIVAFCLLVEMLALPLPSFSQIASQPRFTFVIERNLDGPSVATLVAPSGNIQVNLPDEIAAGDTISGTVIVEPKGANEAEKLQNQAVLNGYVIDLGDGTKISPEKPTFSWTPSIPQTTAAPKYVLRIVEVLGNDGQHLASANLPLLTTPPPVPSSFTLPQLGQTGRPLEIPGPFDGSFSNTSCTIGGQPATVLAESPRKLIAKSPVNVTGPTEIQLKEGNTQTSGQFRNVAVNLTAPKTTLTKGEKTTLTVQVIGLQGITNSIPLQLVTTGSVNMQGGNTQNLQIQPGQVQTNGNYSQTFGLTGTQAGNFNVTATVLVNNPPVGGNNNKCKCKCEFANPPIVTSGKRSAVKGGTEYSYEPNVNIGCTGNRCEVQSVSYSWSIGAASTAKYKIHPGTDTAKKLVVDVTKSGTLVLSVTVTVTCSDGSTCTSTGSKTFDVKVAASDMVGDAAPPKPPEKPVKPPVKPPGPVGGGGGGPPADKDKDKCKCKCEFAKPAIISAGKRSAEGGGTEYSFTPNINTGCSGNRCEIQSIAYSWSVAAASTATATVHAGSDKTGKLVVDVTKSGKLVLTVTVTVTCSDGTTCTATGTATFDVKA